MLRNPQENFEHKYFFTIKDRDDGQIISDYYATNVENLILRNAQQPELRDGLTARGTSPAKTNLGSDALYKANGLKKFLRVVNGAANTSKFQSSDEGITWSDVSGGTLRTTDALWSFAQANDNLYGVNGNDTPIKFDGSVITTIAAIPQGYYCTWWKNHFWVFRNPTYKDRVYFSNPNDPELWTGSDYVNVNLGDQSLGTGIKGTGGFTGRLYLGKERSVWYITGTAAANWALSILTYDHGVASHESMINAQNGMLCIDLEGNVRNLYRSSTDDPFSSLLSKDIPQTIAALNKSSIRLSSAVFYNNFALFFVPYGVSSVNNYVLCYDILANLGKGGFTKFTNWNVARATIFNESNKPKLFMHDSRVANGQTYEWIGTSDNGQAITGRFETKIYDFGVADQEKRFAYSYAFAPALGNYTYNFFASIDRYYYTLLKALSLLGTGNKLLGSTWTLGTDKLGSGGFVKNQINFTDNGGTPEGTTVQVKLELESSSIKLQVRQFTIHFRPYALRSN